MKNYTNIYDIDGKLLRKAGDTSLLTIDEAQKRIDEYNFKIEELEKVENPTRDQLNALKTYTDYVQNLSNFISVEMLKLKPEEVQKMLSHDSIRTEKEDVTAALKDVLNEVKPVSQEDLLVERESSETKMDEYVSFTEVNDEDNKE